VIRTTAILGGAALLLLGAWAAGRSSRGGEPRPPAHREHPACAHPPPEARPAPAPEEKARAADDLETLRSELRRAASDRVVQLNRLQDFLTVSLAEGKLSAAQILEMFRTETDAATLDVLQGAISANPEAADAPGVVDAFVRFAQADADPARRQAAIAFLGSAWDRDGRVREALLGLARDERDPSLRMSALGTLQAYSIKNQEHAGTVNAELLALVRREQDGDVRAQAIGAVEVRSAGPETVRTLAAHLSDPSPAARLASADKLGDAPPASRTDAVAALDRALEREAESGVKALLLFSLVRAGRASAADALRRAAARDPELRADAEDWLAVLGRGHSDWAELSREKASLEAARSR
jgi:hypothetical protein